MSIYEYLEDIYMAGGIDAQEETECMLWNLFNNDEEAFNAHMVAYGVNLSIHTTDSAESDFTLWCWDMEGQTINN